MKIFVFDLLPYAEHLDHLKNGRELPYPLPRRHFKPDVAMRTYEEHLTAWEAMDRLGYDGVGFNEHHTSPYGLMNSPNLMAASAAQRTQRLRAHNENRFSVKWTPPAPRLREYVEALRAIWRCWEQGEKLAYQGQHYRFTLMTPNFVPTSTHQPMVPVTLAAVGPAMLRVAGEVVDGVRLHPFCTRRYLGEVVMRELRTGFAKSGRTRERFEISGGGFIATGADDEAVARMLEWVRYRVAFYGSTPAYWPVLEVHGLGELGRKLNVMSKAGQWDAMAREISDDVLQLFTAVGPHRELARAVAERFGGAADTIALSGGYGVKPDIPPDLVQDIQRIPSTFAGFPAGW
jgi:probable F420-dependent oxidoreductase